MREDVDASRSKCCTRFLTLVFIFLNTIINQFENVLNFKQNFHEIFTGREHGAHVEADEGV